MKTGESLYLFSTINCVNTSLDVSIINYFIAEMCNCSGGTEVEEAWVEEVW